ncbi:MAG: Dynamin-like GTPase that mediates homotypic ER fusion, partial [Pleopsidium flavum]
MSSPQRNGKENRPQVNNRHPTAPSVMTVNGHIASVGETPSKEQYEHGIQVIDEDKEF